MQVREAAAAGGVELDCDGRAAVLRVERLLGVGDLVAGHHRPALDRDSATIGHRQDLAVRQHDPVDERDVGLYREPPADAFWQRVVPIPELDADSAVELLRCRLDPNRLPDAVLAQLVEAAGGNPRRLIALTYDVVVEGADPSSVIQRNQNVQQQISDVSEPARRLLAEVEASGAASPSDQALLTKLGWTRSRASQVFRELEQRGLVRPLERPGPRGRPRRLYEATY